MDFDIGKIINTHGLKGDVKIYPYTDDKKRFEKLKEVFLIHENMNKEANIKEIENVRYQKDIILLKFKGIDNIENAESLKGYILKIPKSDAILLEEDEYFIKDLYGLNVTNNAGEYIGCLEDIIFTGANDVYVIKNIETKEEILIPAIKKYVLKIDLLNKMMIVEIPKWA
ncbi:MAG: ribosome maturation factor RimM [Defluviitaleaceae bacterium]|nr:ribosome maturation factor RimM [Defluviitaleaceae bacterium]